MLSLLPAPNIPAFLGLLGGLLAASILGWVAYQLWLLYCRSSPRLDFPVVGRSSDLDLSAAVAEGVRRYHSRDMPFVVPTSPPSVMLPMALFTEAMNNPDASFNADIYDRGLGRWTHVGAPSPEALASIRGDLNKNLTQVMPLIQDETAYATGRELGDLPDWTAVPLYSRMLHMVSLLSGRVFVGLPLSRDERWVDASVNYTRALTDVFRESDKWSAFVLPLVAPFLSSVRRSQDYQRQAARWMQPLVDELLARDRQKQGTLAGSDPERESDPEKQKSGSAGLPPTSAKTGMRGSFISWLLKHAPRERKTSAQVSISQLLISFAAIHTTSMGATNALFDLAANPELIPELREEVEAVRADGGEALDENGRPYITKSGVARLKKLDSFIKESQRVNGISVSSLTRRLMKDTTFSNGLVLKRGTRIGFPVYAVHHDPKTPTFSPSYNAPASNPGPETFDGLRFYRLREVAGRESRHQAVTTGLDSLAFGHGPHACPGRFFAVYETKMIILDIITRYDIRLVGDVEGTGGMEKRPPCTVHKLSVLPPATANLEFRSRRKVASGEKKEKVTMSE